MTAPAPRPDRWTPGGCLVLVPGDDGHHGTLTLGDVTVHIRRWRREASGVVRFEYQHAGDNWVEEFLGERGR